MSGANRHEFPMNGNPFGPGTCEYGLAVLSSLKLQTQPNFRFDFFFRHFAQFFFAHLHVFFFCCFRFIYLMLSLCCSRLSKLLAVISFGRTLTATDENVFLFTSELATFRITMLKATGFENRE
jgi:hypothetical protein